MFTMSRLHVFSLLTRQILSLVILLPFTLASPVKAALPNGTEAAMDSSYEAGLLSNRPPVAVDDHGPGYITNSSTAFITKDVLVNDRDPDGDFLSVVGFDTSKTIGQVSHLPDGQLDPTFHDDGKVIVDFSGSGDTGNAVVIQPDDKIIVAGRSGDDFALARLNPDGTLDEGFGQNGKVTTDFSGGNDVGNAVLVLPDGKIVVVGGAGVDIAVARYNSNGNLDTSFNKNGKVTTHFLCGDAVGNGAVLQPDGKIVVAGGACGDFTVVRYKTDGSLDASFDFDGIVTTDFSGGNDTGNAVVLGDGGIIIVAGDAAGDFGIIRYNANGSLDSNFGSDGKVTTDFNGNYDYGKTALIQPDGKILVAGIQGLTCIGLARYNPDGSLDLSFNGNGKVGMDCEPNEYNNAIALQRDGKIIMAGNVGYNGSVQFILIRLNSDGSLDPNFDGDGVLYTDFGGMDYAHSITLQADNRIVVLGSTTVSGNGDFALARYNISGTFSYDPNHKFEWVSFGDQAFDTFSYIVSDGILTDTATVTITVKGTMKYTHLPLVYKPCVEGPPVAPLYNGDFEQGHTYWDEYMGDKQKNSLITLGSVEDVSPHSGNWMVHLYGDYIFIYGWPGFTSASITQTVTVPVCSHYLSFWYQARPSWAMTNHSFVNINGTSVWALQFNPYGGGTTNWVHEIVDLNDYAGQTVILTFLLASVGWENHEGTIYFDDIQFQRDKP